MIWLRLKSWWEQQLREFDSQICLLKFLVGGVFGITKYLFGADQASEPVKKVRRAICGNCQYQVYWYGLRRCADCKCFIKAKTGLKSESCPKGNW